MMDEDTLVALIKKHKAEEQGLEPEAPEAETVTKGPESNGKTPLLDRAIAPNYLPRKGRITYRLISRAGRMMLPDRRKPSPDGRYRNKKYQIDCPIDGNMAWNGGTEVLIDVDRGIQIDYYGVKEWTGPDGRWAFRAEVQRWWGNILAAQNADLMKWAKIIVVLILILCGLVTVFLVLGPGAFSQAGGGSP